MSDAQTPEGQPVIIRHRFDVRRRTLTVKEKTTLTPNMIRFVFTADTMEAFSSLSPDDHIKLFFETPEGPAMRDYTPRAFDVAAGTITIDFAIHDAGPATAWAIGAEIGSTLNIGGPRGSGVVAPLFDWYLLIGDETALPAIGRWLEEAPEGTQIQVLAAIADAADKQDFTSRAQTDVNWVLRADPTDPAHVLATLDGLARPAGRGFIWIAAEAQVAKTIRAYVQEAWGHPATDLKSSGYWYAGMAFDIAKSREEPAKH